jgi:hypothetical protein
MNRSVVLSALLIGLSRCSKMTAENYAKLQTGMSFAEVNAILGSPQSCDEALGFRSCQWGDEKSNVTARFVGDKLVLPPRKSVDEAIRIRGRRQHLSTIPRPSTGSPSTFLLSFRLTRQ